MLEFVNPFAWHGMARRSHRIRPLWDAYCFPGFCPAPMVRGIFGDPKARVITFAHERGP
jgi:hypothetical protein